MPNRAIKDQRDDSRPKVGPADSETRRRMLQERLAEREPNRYGKGKARTGAPAKTDLSARGAINAIKDRKYRDRKVIDEAG